MTKAEKVEEILDMHTDGFIVEGGNRACARRILEALGIKEEKSNDYVRWVPDKLVPRNYWANNECTMWEGAD